MVIKKSHIVYLYIYMFISFANAQHIDNTVAYKLITTETEFEAGNPIYLKFSCKGKETPHLYISNSYGTSLLIPHWDSYILHYTIPVSFSNKSGLINWQLIDKKVILSGSFNILPKKKVSHMETYIGPPSINAGGNDHTMLVVIPTDILDNPIAQNTAVTTKHQFLSTEKNKEVFTNNLIAYQNIYSPEKSGRMLVSSESLAKNSNEYSIEVMPAIPTNFKVNAQRPHQYADGNQITTFYTSVIKDKYNNIVSDGTYVKFYIQNSKGYILKTSGTTITGVASAKMIHPDQQEQWSVKAVITGMAESNTIGLSYQQVIKEFQVGFSKNNRTITVGPLQSFMKQVIPDGLQVSITIIKDNKVIKKLLETSREGLVTFYLKSDVFENDTYTIKIETAGSEKIYENKKLW